MISPETWTMRAEILRQLGGRCVCTCGCEDGNLRRLELHHPNGDGNKHRLNLRGINLYKYLSRQLKAHQPIDPPLILLCLNCHGELTRFGACNGGLSTPVADATEGVSKTGQQGRTEQGVLPLDIVSERLSASPPASTVPPEQATRGQYLDWRTQAPVLPKQAPAPVVDAPKGLFSRFTRRRPA